jgi:hypothetical protein
METDDGSGDNQLLLASLKTRLYVMYVPADGKEKNVPERHKLLQAIVDHGGQLLSRKDAQLPENAGKFMALAVNRSAMPRGTLPVPAGTAVYDGTWVFDCIREAALLPTDNYLLVPGGQAGGAQEAPKAAAPSRGARASPLPPASLGNDNQAEQGQRGAGGERATPKKKRCAGPLNCLLPGAQRSTQGRLTRPAAPGRRTRRRTTASCATGWTRSPQRR